MCYAGYTVWVHNKMLSGTQAYANIIDSNTTCNGQFRNSGFSVAQRGFDVPISSDLKSYSIVFIVDGSFYDKCRGPYNNDHDTEWKLTGSTLQWDLEQQA